MEKYLRRCLDSLIIDEEGMKQLEVLVINDGSKDSSSQIAHEYLDKYPDTFRVIDKENGNYGSCINRGLKEATGKYVKVLDADDWFDNSNFRLYIKYINRMDADMVLSACSKIDDFGNEVGEFGLPFKWAFKEYAIGTLAMEQRTSIQMHCVAYKTEMIRKIEYVQLEGISYTDQLWVTYPMAAVKSYAAFNRNLYMYLVGREGQTMDISVQNKKFNDEILVSNRIIDWIEESPKSIIDYEYIRQKMVSRICYMYYNHCVCGLYNEEEFSAFAINLAEKTPGLMNNAEIICGKKNAYNFIHNYNKGTLEPDNCIKSNQESSRNGNFVKDFIKCLLNNINDFYLTMR